MRPALAADSGLSPHRGEISARRINRLLSESAGSKYLEIGVARGHTLEAVDAEWRVGVDPRPLFNPLRLPKNLDFWPTKSDEFFRSNPFHQFDVVFVDGLHEAKQTYRDVINSLLLLNSGGFLLLDDVWPTDAPSSEPDQKRAEQLKAWQGISHKRWYGDVYKVVAALRQFHPELSLQIIGDQREHAQAVIQKIDNKSVSVSVSEAISSLGGMCFEDFFGSSASEPWASARNTEEFFDG